MNRLVLTAMALFVSVSFMQAQTKHTVGEKFGGGIVIQIKEWGKHGLIVEKKDFNKICMSDMVVVADKTLHSGEAVKYNGWRVPTSAEMQLIYSKRALIGGFNPNGLYWHAMQGIQKVSGCLNFKNGSQVNVNNLPKLALVRAVRDF
jgi:nitrogen fixation protein